MKEIDIIEYIKNKSEEYEDIAEQIKAQNPETIAMFKIVEDFLKKSKRVCYGGTAINNILPEKARFYNPKTDIPDYDFFSPDPIGDCKKIVQQYVKVGYTNVEAKPGVHKGTMKVFINFIGVADITFIPRKFYKKLMDVSIFKNNIYYAHPNFLRMSIYNELSRPKGDVSRWNKVYSRLLLLNKYYPIEISKKLEKSIQRFRHHIEKEEVGDIIWNSVVNKFIMTNNLVLFGLKLNRLYQNILENLNVNIANYFSDSKNIVLNYSILSDDAKNDAERLAIELESSTGLKTNIIKHEGLGEILEEHYEIEIFMPNSDNIRNIFMYQTIYCSSYYEIEFDRKTHQKINIASIETCLHYYFTFTLAEREYYDPEQILYLCDKLIRLSSKFDLLTKKGIDPYPYTCIGKEYTKEEMLERTQYKRKELRKNKEDPLYDFYFFKYRLEDALKDLDIKLNSSTLSSSSDKTATSIKNKIKSKKQSKRKISK